MNKKYELTDEFIEHDGVKLYRIKAIRSFVDVKKGDLGGFVQSEDNLSHEGDSWVSGYAWVYGDARVYGNAWVSGDETKNNDYAQSYINSYKEEQKLGNHHELKCINVYFEHIINGNKTFEIRDNTDRGFQKGDTVQLNETATRDLDKVHYSPTGRSINIEITYVTNFQQKDGYVVFGFNLNGSIENTLNEGVNK